MHICAIRYLCNAIQQIVLEMSCGFSLIPHFQFTFPSFVLDFKLFSQNIPSKMISKKKISILKNPEVATCYSKYFNRKFRSNLTYFQNNLFRANFKKHSNLIKCLIILYCESNNAIVTVILYSTVIFGTRQIILNISCPVI